MNKLIRKQPNQYNSIKFISENQTQCENTNGNINLKNFQNNSKQINIQPKKFCIPSPKSIKKDKHCLKLVKNNKKINLLHSIYDQTFQQIKLNFQKQPSLQQNKIQKPKPYLKSISKKQTKVINHNQKFKKIIFNQSFSDDEQKKTEQLHQQNPQQKISVINQINQQKQNFQDLSSQNQSKNQKYIVFDSLLQRRLQQIFIENILSKQFSKQKYYKNLKWILLAPVPNQIALRFQVHIYKNLLKTEYQLWVQMESSSQLRLIATAHNPNVNLDKSIFTIQQVNLRNQKIFCAQLQSNFSRNIYNLYGYGLNSTQILQQDEQIQQLLHIKLDKMKQMYVPIDKNRNITCYKKSLNKNLAQIYEQPNSKEMKIQKIKSSNEKLNFNENSKFAQFRNYQKIFFLQNQLSDKLIFIGKMASKKYQLLVGKNISPLQAFSFTIAHLQNR